ncbi:uncharacterized protein LOC127878588 [Dreissena polymorpha]|uniref:uncharacterized protein LOC127878588 n=1 Tax=Dreissena polymorpha TaxID=45954 RepID=UPI002263C2FB|nr:uncharacterized protein LOC127878588 [Dreissena polymorpha]
MVVDDLQKQVMDKRLLRTIPYYVTCQTTSELESFNNHLLIYAPKRNALRTQLADKDGNLRWKRSFSKAANNWSVKPVKEVKQYKYIPDLLTKIAGVYLAGEDTLRSAVKVDPLDPRRISAHIATISPKPQNQRR